MPDIVIKGRHASSYSRSVFPEFIGEIGIDDKFVSVRIDDINNPEFWLEVNIPVETIQKLLAEAGYKVH